MYIYNIMMCNFYSYKYKFFFHFEYTLHFKGSCRKQETQFEVHSSKNKMIPKLCHVHPFEMHGINEPVLLILNHMVI